MVRCLEARRGGAMASHWLSREWVRLYQGGGDQVLPAAADGCGEAVEEGDGEGLGAVLKRSSKSWTTMRSLRRRQCFWQESARNIALMAASALS